MASIILTRAEEDNVRTARELEVLGHPIHFAPMIELREIAHSSAALERMRPSVDGSVVLLTSGHATDRWLGLRRGVFAACALRGYLVVGDTSARRLASSDPVVPILRIAPSASELAAQLDRSLAEITSRVVNPCSALRRHEAIGRLRDLGFDVQELPLYEPVVPADAGARIERALSDATPPRVLVFFSPSAVSGWFSLRSDIPPDSIFVAIGPTTADALGAHGVADVTTAVGTGGEALRDAVARSLRRWA